jgi:hypothetical protein
MPGRSKSPGEIISTTPSKRSKRAIVAPEAPTKASQKARQVKAPAVKVTPAKPAVKAKVAKPQPVKLEPVQTKPVKSGRKPTS